MDSYLVIHNTNAPFYFKMNIIPQNLYYVHMNTYDVFCFLLTISKHRAILSKQIDYVSYEVA